MIQYLRRYIRFGFLLLLPAYFAILANSVMNKHTHILPDGILLTHAHPLKSTDSNTSNSHHHSEKEFFFFQSFCIGYYTVSETLISFQKQSIPSEVNSPICHEQIPSLAFSAATPHRGPPLVS